MPTSSFHQIRFLLILQATTFLIFPKGLRCASCLLPLCCHGSHHYSIDNCSFVSILHQTQLPHGWGCQSHPPPMAQTDSCCPNSVQIEFLGAQSHYYFGISITAKPNCNIHGHIHRISNYLLTHQNSSPLLLDYNLFATRCIVMYFCRIYAP